jgi:hypothetical protein
VVNGGQLPMTGVTEAMRVEIGQAGAAERLAKYLSDRLGRAPALTLQTGRLEGPTGANSDFGLREERVGLSPKQRASKIFDPLGYYPQRFVADGEEPGREALAAFGSHLPRILKDLRLCKVDMLELERSHRAVPRTRQDGKGDQRAIAFSVSVAVGIEASTWTICSSVGTAVSRRALAIRASLSDRLK